MKKNTKRKPYKYTVSLALASCFGFVPSLDAVDSTPQGPMNVNQLVQSVSSILGGQYNPTNSSPTQTSFGSSAAGTIYVNDQGNAVGLGTSGTWTTGGSWNTTTGATSSGLNNNPTISNYNLYGQNGLLSNFTDNGVGLNYNYTNPLASLGNQFSLASLYYGYRTALAGATGANNLLNPGTAITNSYYTTLNSGSAIAGAKGNLGTSLLNNAGQQTQVNALLTSLYTTITNINKAINVSGTGATGVANYVADYSSSGAVGSTGATFLGALNSIASDNGNASSLTGLAASINTLSTALGIKALGTADQVTANAAIFGAAQQTLGNSTYTVSGAALTALQNIDTLQNLVSGGIVTTQTPQNSTTTNYISNANYTAAYTLYNAQSSNLNVITNNILNGASVSQVAAAIDALNKNGFGVANAGQLQTALNGLVNPSQYKAVYDAYDAIAKAITDSQTNASSSKPSYTAIFTDATTNAAIINSLVKFGDAYTQLTNSGNTAVSVGGGSLFNLLQGNVSSNSAQAQALYSALNGNSSALNALNAALSALKGVSNDNTAASPLYVSSTTTKNDTGTKQNENASQYPINGTGTNASPTITSYTTTSAANTTALTKAEYSALSSLLGNAITYSSGQSTLAGLLKGGGSVAQQILTVGLQNAAANSLLGADNTTNPAATTINQIKAIYGSQELLSAYIGAALSPNNNIKPDTQAQILTGLNQALSASQADNGLIAQTVGAIEGLLNSSTLGNANITAPSLATLATDLGVSSGTPFKGTATISEISAALSAMTELKGIVAGSDAAGMSAAATAAAVTNFATNLKLVVDNLSEITIRATSATATATTLATAFNNLTTTPAPIDGAIIVAGPNRTQVEAAIVFLLGGAGGMSGNSATSNPLKDFATATSAYTNISDLSTEVTNVINLATKIDAVTTNAVSAWGSTFLGSGITGGNLSNIATAQSAITTYDNKVAASFTPSQQQDFVSGLASNPKTTIQTLQAEAQNYLNAYNAWKELGNSTNATWTSSGVQLSSNTLSSLLTAAGAKPGIDLGFATTAANSIESALGKIQTAVGNANFTSSSFSKSLSTLGAIDTSGTTLYNLNTAVAALFKADPKFFAAGTQTTASAGNLNNISNIYVGNLVLQNGAVQGNPSEGIGSASVGGGFQQNPSASAYFTNLVNLNTITDLLGNVVGGTASNPAISSKYTTAFSTSVTNGAGSTANGVVNGVMSYTSSTANNFAYLTSPSAGFKTGEDATLFVQKLISLGNAIGPGVTLANISTTNMDALKAFFTTPGDGTSSGDLFNALTAWRAIAFASSSAPAGTQSLLTQMGTLVGDASAATSATGVIQLLNDANNLYNANAGLTGSDGLAGAQVSNSLLSVNSTNAAAFNQATNAATALGQLISALKGGGVSSSNTASTVAGNVIGLIQDLNTYNHNIALLNNLAPTSTGAQAGASVASQILNYLQQNTSMGNVLQTVSQAKAQELQGLLNRLQYLQGLQAQVQQAIDNNPYALVMGKSQAASSTALQASGKALTSSTGLFNTATGNTLFTSKTASGVTTYTPTSDMSSNFASLDGTMGYQMANLSNYNGLIADLSNSSSSILLNPNSTVEQSAAQTALNNIAKSVYNITNYFAPVSTPTAAGGTSANTSSFNTISNAYTTMNSALGLNPGQTANSTITGIFSTGASGAAGSGAVSSLSSFLTASTEQAGAATNKSTVLQGMQAIVDLNSLFGSIQSNAAGDAASTGYTNFTNSIATLSAAGQTSNNITGVAGGAINAAISSLMSGFDQTSGSSTNYATNASLTYQYSGKMVQVLQALENNSAAANLINNSAAITADTVNAAFTGSSAKTAAWTSLQNALTSIVGKENAGNVAPSVSSAANTVALLQAAQKLVGLEGVTGGAKTDGGSGSTAGLLQILNSGMANYIAPNSANIVNAIPQLIQKAQTLEALYTTIQASTVASAAANSTVLLPGAAAANTAIGIKPSEYQIISQIVTQADAIMSNSTSSSSATDTGGVLNTDQAALQYAQSQTSSTASIPRSNALSSASFAGLVAYELQQQNPGVASITTPTQAGAVITAATPAQLSAAVNAALSNSALTTTMMQPVVDNALKSVLEQISTYTDNSNTLQPMLNSSKASIQSILNAALNNASSLQGLLSKLNPSATDLSGGNVSNTGLSSTGLLPSKVIAKIEQTLANMKTNSATYTAASTAIQNGTSAAAKQAQQIEAAITAQNAMNANLNALTILGNTQFNSQTVGNYLNEVATVTQAQAEYMAANYNLPALMAQLNGLKSDFDSNNGQGVFKAIATAYQTIMQSGNLNPSAATQSLANLISDISSLQDQVVNALAGLMQQNGAGQTQQNGGAQVMASVKGGGEAHSGVLMVTLDKQGGGSKLFEMPAGNPQQQINALKTLLQNLQSTSAFAKASLMKLNSDLKSMAVATTRTASHMPMQTMNSNGNMYGIDVQFGYKQFFGKKKRWGVRYYANFSYQHGTFMTSDASELDNFVYGAGVDALYNFYESKDGKYTSGLFAGLMLEGSSWAVKGQSYYDSLVAQGLGKMNTSYFQIPINLGFRTNVNKHNGFEIGLRIPLATNYYYKGLNEFGDKLDIAYKRNVSVFFNYVYNF
ncbi:outer membrane protein [Helicobacter ailurogastricus]|uniref:outer membrane protein n=1 Tax=Helicobacter ailurogastricus TaxID=1578720 RepID=UPI0022CC3DB8|nr:outer membrane protein [Helicobacter ailurogastricus]GLH58485.1 hypothetical protein NHP214376_12760 [Helicobacter ailurogastricus]GLH59992.1 hypothetical protein NHP214377_12630 [Helicobacter ailurogastricus]